MSKEFECVAGHFTKAILNSIHHPTSKPYIQYEWRDTTVRVEASGHTARGRFISLHANYEHLSPSKETKPDGKPEKYNQTNRVGAVAEVNAGGQPRYEQKIKPKRGVSGNRTDTLSHLQDRSVIQRTEGNIVEAIEARSAIQKMLPALQAAPAKCGLDATR